MTTRTTSTCRRALFILIFLAAAQAALAQEPQPSELSSEGVVARVSPSVAVVLTGAGAGRLAGVGSAVMVRSDGVLLTAYHLIKDAREVQVRLNSGEVYDRVELIGVDERRDIAAIHIPVANSPALPVTPLDEARPGQSVFVVSNPTGLTWSASAGVVSAVRPVEDVVPTQNGYRVLQFTAPVSPGSSGGAVVDSMGRILGIVVFSKQGQALNFAVPIDSVLGLASGSDHTLLPSGRDLQPLRPEPKPASASLTRENPAELLRNAHTIFISSRTAWFTPSSLETELMNHRAFRDLGFVIVRDPKLADLRIEVDRPLWTYTFTVNVQHVRTSMLLGTDQTIAASGDLAAITLAEKLVKMLAATRAPSSVATTKTE